MTGKIKKWISINKRNIIKVLANGAVAGAIVGVAYYIGVKTDRAYIGKCLDNCCLRNAVIESVSNDGMTKYIVSCTTKTITND